MTSRTITRAMFLASLTGAALIAAAPQALAARNQNAETYVQQSATAALAALGARTPAAQRTQTFHQLMSQFADIPRVANFVLGPNAVLPTSGAAKTSSALSVYDFIKRSSVAYVTQAGYGEAAVQARRLATYEGFDGHANAVSETRDRLMRVNAPKSAS